MADWDPFEQRLRRTLESFEAKADRRPFAVASHGFHYVRFSLPRRRPGFLAEAVAEHGLPPGHPPYTPEQRTALAALGWRPPADERSDHVKEFGSFSLAFDAARLGVATLRDVFGADPGAVGCEGHWSS